MIITGRSVLLFLCTVLIAFLLSFSVIKRNEYLDTHRVNNANVKGLNIISEYPKIVNVAPSSVMVDGIYTFEPLVSINGGESRSAILEIIEGPAWMFLEDGVVFGIPGGNSIGDHKVIIRAWNGSIYSDYIYYVNVYDEGE